MTREEMFEDMNIGIVIPARLKSTRLKEKMLIDIDGEPLIRYMFDRVRTMGYDTYVVTDSPKIAEYIPKGHVIMSHETENGTARIASVLDELEQYDVIINVQGDMVDIDAWHLRTIVNRCKQGFDYMLTAYTKGYEPDGVKCIHQEGKALWFTRNDIGYGDRHVGIYAYKPSLLRAYDLLHDSYPVENLEQNRVLGYYDIDVVKIEYNGKEINTKEDIDSWTMQH
jgi:3-deoxy-manno-octulosonate cytidylyltransferase (CMP-KDO synthetase)